MSATPQPNTHQLEPETALATQLVDLTVPCDDEEWKDAIERLAIVLSGGPDE